MMILRRVLLLGLVLCGLAGMAQAQQTPLTMEEAVAQAQARNPVLQQRFYAAEAAEQRVQTQRLGRLPVITFSTAIARSNEAPKIPITINGETFVSEQGSANSMQLRLQADYALYDFGKTRYGVEAARYERAALQAAYDRQAADVILQVKQQFYRARFYTRLDSLYGAGIPFGEQLEQIAQAQVQNGAALPLGVLRAQVDLQNTRAQQALAQSEAEKARIQLAVLMGREDTDFMPAGDLPALPDQLAPATLYTGLFEQAIQNRQEFQQFAYQQQQQQALTRLATAQARPSLVLQSSAVYYGPKSAFGVDVPELNPFNIRVGLGLTYNLLGPKAARIRTEEIEALSLQVGEQATALRLQIGAQIRSLLSDLAAQQAVIQSSQTLLNQAKTNLNLVEIDYRNGAASLLDYTAARVTATAAEASLAQTRFNVAQLLLQLESVVGAEIRFVSE